MSDQTAQSGALRGWLVVLLLLGVACTQPVAEAQETQEAQSETETETDPDTGLLMQPGWELVRGQCTACHSAALVTQNRGDRAHWREIIRWMQQTQGLWAFDESTEAQILDYLSTAYAAKEGVRRANLSNDLMPPPVDRTAD